MSALSLLILAYLFYTHKLGNGSSLGELNEVSYLMKVVVGGKISKNILKHYFHLDSESLLDARGFDFALREIRVRDKSIKLQFWILNAPFLDSDRSSLYYGSIGLIIFFHKNDNRSLKKVSRWFNAFEKHSVRRPKSPPKELFALVGIPNNHEMLPSEKGSSVAHKLGMVYYETSPKTTETTRILTDLCTKMAEAYLTYVETLQSKHGTPSLP